MEVTINKTYNIDTDKDIDPFAGTNLDEASKNTRSDALEETYNTYKNTVYEYDTSEGWKEKLASTVKNSDYATTASIRNQMDSTSTINILQKKGIGTKINSSTFNAHSNRTDTYKIEPKEYKSDKIENTKINKGVVNGVSHSGIFDTNMNFFTGTQENFRKYVPTTIDKIENTKINKGVVNGVSHSGIFDTNMNFFTGTQENFRKYVPTTIDNIAKTKINKGVAGAFDKNMNLLTNSANQMTYRDYKLDNEDKPADTYTDMSITINQSEITGEKWEGSGDDKTMVFTRSTIIEAGNHFNRGNDTTEVTEKDGEGGAKIKEGIDINSSKVLDRSMLFNTFGSDALGERTVEIE